MANKVLKAAQADAEKALGLLDSETADALIGDPQPEEYGKLIRGVRGAHTMMITMASANGMRVNGETLKMNSQAELILLTMVHYAYALGIQYGRENP